MENHQFVKASCISNQDNFMMTLNTHDDYPEGGERANENTLDDLTLWKSFRSGDINAYAFIYRKYFFVLFNYGKKLNQDHELVKDCIQELFIKIWNNRDNLSETTAIKYYLFTALKRKLLDVMRKPHLEVQIEENDESFSVMDPEDYSGQEFGSPHKDNVARALNRLSAHQQKILDLKFQKNLSNKEIADELGIGIQSVYNAVFKALRSIRKHLSAITVIELLVMFS
jgi:RNA polymerase sigma factor (sigma-70 family)